MDELSPVQNASYENKKDLLIYKLESYNLFKNMVDMMNRKTRCWRAGRSLFAKNRTEEERLWLPGPGLAVKAERAARQRIAIQSAEAERRPDSDARQPRRPDISGNNN